MAASPTQASLDAGAIDGGPDAGAIDGGRDAGAIDGGQHDAGAIDGGPRPPTEAVAYQIDCAHSGFQTDETLAPPLTQRWHVDFPGSLVGVSYPLIAGGRVFVQVTRQLQPNEPTATSLYAIDQATGATVWGPIELGSASSDPSKFILGLGIAYDAGKVFALYAPASGVNIATTVQAFDALDGASLWARSFVGGVSSPTANGRAVYVSVSKYSGDASLYALSAANGRTLWNSELASSMNWPWPGPAVALSDSTIFVLASCTNDYAFNFRGRVRWQTEHENCRSGSYAVFSGGRLFADSAHQSVMLGANDGSVLGSMDATGAPAIHGSLGFFVNDFNTREATVTARSLSDLATRWRFTPPGDDITAAPLVVSGHVFVGGAVSGKLYALDEQTGALVWSDDVGAPIVGLETFGARTGGIAAAAGVLVVSASDRVVAYW